jgi:hypothetical protein
MSMTRWPVPGVAARAAAAIGEGGCGGSHPVGTGQAPGCCAPDTSLRVKENYPMRATRHRHPRRRRLVLSCSPIAAAVLVAGCSVTGEPLSGDDAAVRSEPAVDIAALDTGDYPTDPRPDFGKTTADNVGIVDAKNISNYVAVPFEIDRDLTDPIDAYYEVVSPASLDNVIPDEQAAAATADSQFAYAFSSAASTPDVQVRAGVDRRLYNIVLRFRSAESATDGARRITDAAAQSYQIRPTTPDGLTDTQLFGKDYPSIGDRESVAITVHNSYVFYQRYNTTLAERDRHEPTLRTAVTTQTELIDQFPAVPTEEQAAAQGISDRYPLVDPHRLLIYTLPDNDDDRPILASGVFAPRGAAHRSYFPTLEFQTMTDTHALLAVDRSTVYRADSADGARTLLDTTTRTLTGAGWTVSDSPPALPHATCHTRTNTTLCRVTYGRYLGLVVSDDPTDAHQQISAQYVILTKADQNAR